MARKPKTPEPEEQGESAPLWIISFADLVTLMLSFFVILAAGNNQQARIEPDLAEIAAAIRTAFRYVPPADSNDPIDLQILLQSLRSQRGKGGSTGKRGEAQTLLHGAPGIDDRVTTVRTGSENTVGTVVRFDRDSTVIHREGVALLAQIALRLRGHTNVVFVKGHTSRDEEYRLRGSSRDLAHERATAVAARLTAMGVSPETLRTQSCRDFEPQVERAYAETAHGVNRRVEIVSTEGLVSELQGDPRATSTAEDATVALPIADGR